MKAERQHPGVRRGLHRRAWRRSSASCRSASASISSPNQPAVVEEAVGGFTQALFEAIVIVLVGQLPQPRPARRPGRRDRDPAGAGRHLRLHGVFRHHAAAHLARRADHRARPAGRRRHDLGRDDGGAARGRRIRSKGRDLRLHLDRLSDADRHAGHGRRLRADRPQQQLGRRIHLHAVRRDRLCAADLLGRRGAVHAAARRDHAAEAVAARSRTGQVRLQARFSTLLLLAMRRRWLTIGLTVALFAAVGLRPAASCSSSSSRPPTGRSCWST